MLMIRPYCEPFKAPKFLEEPVMARSLQTCEAGAQANFRRVDGVAPLHLAAGHSSDSEV